MSLISIEQVDRLLPQTQCGKCGHPGCRPYAEALLQGEPINQCPPGGGATVAALAALLDRPVIPLREPAESPRLAVIREAECIGCTKCIQACPVDAILGAPKHMHTVITSECTGCELCVEPCPVDCIDLVTHPHWAQANTAEQQQAYLDARADNGRRRFQAHTQRIAQRTAEDDARRRARRKTRLASSAQPAATTSSTNARHIAAQRRRLIQKRDRLAPDDTARAAFDAQIARLDAGQTAEATSSKPPTSKKLRLALAAAEATQRRAERHLQHCIRQESADVIEKAREQLRRAEDQVTTAQHALNEHTTQ